MPYDYLVVSVGATTNTFNTPGVREHCIFLKQVQDAQKLRKVSHEKKSGDFVASCDGCDPLVSRGSGNLLASYMLVCSGCARTVMLRRCCRSHVAVTGPRSSTGFRREADLPLCLILQFVFFSRQASTPRQRVKQCRKVKNAPPPKPACVVRESVSKAIGNCFERANLPTVTEEQRVAALTFAVVGAGPTGVECCAELRDFIEEVRVIRSAILRCCSRMLSFDLLSKTTKGQYRLSCFQS